MSDISLIKTHGVFIPADAGTEEIAEKMHNGEILHGDFKKARNPEFHRKYFALLNAGFSLWEPGEIDSKWGAAQKNFEQYREQVQVLAGFGEPVFNLDGTFRMRSKSISFARMGEEEFAVLYSKVLDVILSRIGCTKESLEDQMAQAERIVGFA